MEKYVGIGMVAGDKIDFLSDMIDLKMEKFARLDKLDDISTVESEEKKKKYRFDFSMG